MKKLVLIILFFIFPFVVFSATTPSQPYAYYLLGYIKDNTRAWIDLAHDSLPFDLMSQDVQYNGATRSGALNKPQDIRGQYIGVFSLFSNSTSFRVYITHTTLDYSGTVSGDLGESLTRIDYRLYIQMGSKYGNDFRSCLSSTSLLEFPDSYPDAEQSDFIMITGGDSCFAGAFGSGTQNLISVVNSGVYVSLEDNGTGTGIGATEATTITTTEKLLPGYYSSTIYLHLVGV